MHNPHRNRKGRFLLYGFIRNHFSLGRIRKKADFRDDCGDRIVPEEIIVRICLNGSFVIIRHKILRLLLDKGSQFFPFLIGRIIEDLRTVLCRIGIAVLMDTDRTVGMIPGHDFLSVFQVAGFFPGYVRVFQAPVGASGQNDLNAVLLQNGFAFEGKGKVNVFFSDSRDADLSGVTAAVTGIKNYGIMAGIPEDIEGSGKM